MILCRLLLLAVTLVACGSDPPDQTQVDAPTGLPACTRATYDPCSSNTECDSSDCHLFMMDGFQICTTPCTPNDNSTCPLDATGVNGECNNRGICKPAAANACSPD